MKPIQLRKVPYESMIPGAGSHRAYECEFKTLKTEDGTGPRKYGLTLNLGIQGARRIASGHSRDQWIDLELAAAIYPRLEALWHRYRCDTGQRFQGDS